MIHFWGKDAMATVTLPNGQQVSGVEVQTVESTERWSEFTLEDGTVLRLKLVVSAFIRADGHFDADGNPVYAIRGGPAMNYISVRDEYKRKAS
jgi:hypothetical protein